MLAEQDLVDRAAAAALLAEIELLRAGGFAPLQGAEARRGHYLLYEDWLAGRLGERTAGILRTGRSRNDLNATVLLLRLRPPVERLVTATLRLQAVLLAGSRRHAGTVMPAYTHYQPAVPTTYGHHLGGVARALDRDLAALGAAAAGLDACPLGAGVGHGTALPIVPARTAALLGFERPAPHALDAVASRDVILRLLSAAAILGVTVSRLGADLLLWTTAEFAFLELPDELVGSSSAMPQKRNPFLFGAREGPFGAGRRRLRGCRHGHARHAVRQFGGRRNRGLRRRGRGARRRRRQRDPAPPGRGRRQAAAWTPCWPAPSPVRRPPPAAAERLVVEERPVVPGGPSPGRPGPDEATTTGVPHDTCRSQERRIGSTRSIPPWPEAAALRRRARRAGGRRRSAQPAGGHRRPMADRVGRWRRAEVDLAAA